VSLNKLELQHSFEFTEEILSENNIEILPVHLRHLKQLLILPFYHRDPFDRLILSQAISEKLVIVTKDGVFEKYTSNTLW
jgi:PIN domain nuclease of toxin-antitoxin system